MIETIVREFGHGASPGMHDLIVSFDTPNRTVFLRSYADKAEAKAARTDLNKWIAKQKKKGRTEWGVFSMLDHLSDYEQDLLMQGNMEQTLAKYELYTKERMADVRKKRLTT